MLEGLEGDQCRSRKEVGGVILKNFNIGSSERVRRREDVTKSSCWYWNKWDF